MPNPSQLDPVERQVVLLLKRERLRQGLSCTQLALNVGVSRTTITHLEANEARPTLWVLLKLAGGLGVDLADYLSQAAALVIPPKLGRRKGIL